MRLVLVHSIFLGPSSWMPTAKQLRTLGYTVEVPDLRDSLHQEPCLSSFIAATVAAVDRAPPSRAVLIGHSRSGPLLPAVAAGCHQPAIAILLVDAALPYPGRSWVEEAPPDRVAAMRGMATAGRLPRWSDWWGDSSVIARLIPEPDVRARFIDELPQVPSGFLDERLPDLEWRGRSGYLQLSTPYAAAADTARASGWPVEQRDLDHLAIVTAPVEVASAIAKLLNDLMPARA